MRCTGLALGGVTLHRDEFLVCDEPVYKLRVILAKSAAIHGVSGAPLVADAGEYTRHPPQFQGARARCAGPREETRKKGERRRMDRQVS